MTLSNEFIKTFLSQRDIKTTHTEDDGGVVCVFDKRYRVHITPVAFDRILLRSFITFFPVQQAKKELFIQKVLKVMQANLFTAQTSLFCDPDQQAIYAQCDVFDITTVNNLEFGLEGFLNAIDFFRQIFKEDQ
ncbi:type III secretion system chaperone [Candidatus Ichthyocystis hellenicum]|uniref:type III secretion system chaperone n=1 Tax=Candidatus Ichthyocystis hellenicum TaxID=1561003 RepID=UPI000B863605|nr:type III secretion system chaperone [Candidatus Ichthyocystis hellenicum]